MSLPPVPSNKVQKCNDRTPRKDGDYIIYWMIANRRLAWNFSLQRALEWCTKLGKPLVILEALRCDYPWASDRLHQFVIDGILEKARQLQGTSITYYPFVETQQGQGSGLLEAMAKRASLVVTDDFPCFFLPRMVAAAARKIDILMEKVDSNGLLPMRVTDRVFQRAYDFRRFLQKSLRPHLLEMPSASPVTDFDIPAATPEPDIYQRWPMLTQLVDSGQFDLKSIPIDHEVQPVTQKGGSEPAHDQLRTFLAQRLPKYGEFRNQPAVEATSGFSPYLHFGFLSVHQIFMELAKDEDWNPGRLSDNTSGAREGWWGMSQNAESFLDELVTWREVGFNMCSHVEDYDKYESLPDWARQTLAEHSGDKRKYLYTLAQFENAQTHDALWNAAQTQLLREGRIHNYLRMLWGKKIIEWSESPRKALDIMIELNNKYALDGRDPNSYSGIFWVLGRYDRPWGPERHIFGKIRYMSSENTARKVDVKGYIRKYADASSQSSGSRE